MKWLGHRVVTKLAAALFLMATFIPANPVRSKLVPFQNYINDYAEVIPESIENHLNALLKKLKDKTGAQIAVVIINSTEGVRAADEKMARRHQPTPFHP